MNIVDVSAEALVLMLSYSTLARVLMSAVFILGTLSLTSHIFKETPGLDVPDWVLSAVGLSLKYSSILVTNTTEAP